MPVLRSRPSRFVRWVPGALFLVAITLLLVSCDAKRETLSTTQPRPAPEPVRWTLNGSEGERLKDGEGTYQSGETLFIPAGAQFSLTSQSEVLPQFAAGPEYTYWTSQGGRCEHDPVTGERWNVRAA